MYNNIAIFWFALKQQFSANILGVYTTIPWHGNSKRASNWYYMLPVHHLQFETSYSLSFINAEQEN